MKEYNKNYGFDVAVERVTHITSKAMVSNRLHAVFLRKNQKFSENELIALANHEIGVHLVTTFNAKNQPLKIYEYGTPFNVESQEGLAVLSEYYSGSLTLTRLRELALRVILADRVVKDYSFSSSFDLLLTTYGLDRDTTDEYVFSVVNEVVKYSSLTREKFKRMILKESSKSSGVNKKRKSYLERQNIKNNNDLSILQGLITDSNMDIAMKKISQKQHEKNLEKYNQQILLLEDKINTNEEELLKIKGEDAYIDWYDLHMKNMEVKENIKGKARIDIIKQYVDKIEVLYVHLNSNNWKTKCW